MILEVCAAFSEILVSYHTTQHHNPDNLDLNLHHSENLKYCKINELEINKTKVLETCIETYMNLRMVTHLVLTW
jgi:hypothetical protein